MVFLVDLDSLDNQAAREMMEMQVSHQQDYQVRLVGLRLVWTEIGLYVD